MSWHRCAVCGLELTILIQRCRGCKLTFCQSCLEAHLIQNWRFLARLYPEPQYRALVEDQQALENTFSNPSTYYGGLLS